MREYALSQALHQDQTHAFAGARRMLSNLLKRRRLRRVEELDDHILDDIGLTRAELATALSLPLSMDPIWELNRQSRGRRSSLGRRHL
jgi:uncharacterized protein YjiS (DUF1127 family)